ncbi:aromatic-ring-hydroxylating dioxygenase subunit beta [Nocardioides jensenii]|uniref:aromatic-ring-hydroxylating dioxygenase subunit beta n=1 Tax=Nocardioides jensenii TaxID=1843 RepID=UPI00082A85C9|nr:aromatic-ring-hydroxylating dioxygenase subunit beta [Nocardioides jensenii]
MSDADADVTGADDRLPILGGTFRRSLPGEEGLATRLQCERFINDEAALLDAWALDDWYDLFAADGDYVVPSTDDIYGDADLNLALINETKDELAGRVQRLKSTWAHIENPHSRTRRVVSNVRPLRDQAGQVHVEANFVVYRSRPHQTTTHAGLLEYSLVRVEDTFLIKRKVARLVHETLRDSGGVLSILL